MWCPMESHHPQKMIHRNEDMSCIVCTDLNVVSFAGSTERQNLVAFFSPCLFIIVVHKLKFYLLQLFAQWKVVFLSVEVEMLIVFRFLYL